MQLDREQDLSGFGFPVDLEREVAIDLVAFFKPFGFEVFARVDVGNVKVLALSGVVACAGDIDDTGVRIEVGQQEKGEEEVRDEVGREGGLEAAALTTSDFCHLCDINGSSRLLLVHCSGDAGVTAKPNQLKQCVQI